MRTRGIGAWRRARGLVAVAALGGLSAVALAGCVWISEGCVYPDELGSSAVIPLELDAEQPAVASTIEIALTAGALPGDVEDRGARLRLTLDNTTDVALTLVPEDAGVPVPLIASQGKVSLPLDACEADKPCTVRALVIAEWMHPQADTPLESQLTVEGLVRVPRTKDRCGFGGGNPVTVTAGLPEPRSAALGNAVGETRHDATELVRHVTVRFGAGGEAPAPGDDSAIAYGHLAFTPDPDPPKPGTYETFVPGLWVRVTPDDGGVPLLDGPVPVPYPPLPADATFPIDASCVRPCERGYWIQAAVYDPGKSAVNVPSAAFGWALDAGISSATSADGSREAVDLTIDGTTGRQPPASLIQRGTGAPFRVDGSHPVTTLAIDVTAPARAAAPFGDTITEVPVEFQVTTVPIEGSPSGQLWLSNGHYIGDGSTGDDQADTGATGGPTTRPTPAGRPFATCAGTLAACTARTGLVLHQYDDAFDNGAATPPFDVEWEWSVVGAPPGATVAVEPVEGETLDAAASGAVNLPVVGGRVAIAALVAFAGLAGLAAVLVLLATRRRRTSPSGPPGPPGPPPPPGA